MIGNIILLCVMTLLPATAFSAITMPVFNDNASSHTGYVAFNGVPINLDDSTPLITNLKVTSDEEGTNEIDAQFDVISRYDENSNGADSGDKIRTVMVTFEATVPASSHADYYLQITSGGGNAAGSDMITNETLYYQIDTGSLSAISVTIDLKRSATFTMGTTLPEPRMVAPPIFRILLSICPIFLTRISCSDKISSTPNAIRFSPLSRINTCMMSDGFAFSVLRLISRTSPK